MQCLTLPEVCAKVRLGKSAIYAYVAAGTFPRPIKPSKHRSLWIESEVDAWLCSKIEERDADE